VPPWNDERWTTGSPSVMDMIGSPGKFGTDGVPLRELSDDRVKIESTEISELALGHSEERPSMLRWFCSSFSSSKAALGALDHGAGESSRPRTREASTHPKVMHMPAVVREPSGGERRPPATFELDISMMPCTKFSGDWLVQESIRWHRSVRGEETGHQRPSRDPSGGGGHFAPSVLKYLESRQPQVVRL